MDAEAIAKKAMNIAADLCVYTNHDHMIEVLESTEETTSSIVTAEKQNMVVRNSGGSPAKL